MRLGWKACSGVQGDSCWCLVVLAQEISDTAEYVGVGQGDTVYRAGASDFFRVIAVDTRDSYLPLLFCICTVLAKCQLCECSRQKVFATDLVELW